MEVIHGLTTANGSFHPSSPFGTRRDMFTGREPGEQRASVDKLAGLLAQEEGA